MSEAALDLGCGCDSRPRPGRLLSLDDAITLARAIAQPVGESELVDLRHSAGRILARDLYAPRPMPFFDNSAVDGFAVRTSDLDGDGPWHLPIEGTVPAGTVPDRNAMAGKYAVRIFTGAPLPSGLDCVVMQEDCDIRADGIVIANRPKPGQNIRHAGEDVARGARLLGVGQRIEPRHIGLLAGNGYAAVNAMRKIRVAVFSTGNEVTEPGGNREGAAIYDANRSMMLTLAERAATTVTDLGIVADNREALTDLFGSLGDQFDIVISTGGVSVGERDFIRPAFERAGGTIRNWRVAVKPGKPVMLGRRAKTLFTGLPGNPLAAYIGFRLFADPQIAQLSGTAASVFAPHHAVAAFDWRRKPGRTEFFPVRLCGVDPSGVARVERLGNGGSASLYPLSFSDGVGVVAAETEHIRHGDRISWQPHAQQ